MELADDDMSDDVVVVEDKGRTCDEEGSSLSSSGFCRRKGKECKKNSNFTLHKRNLRFSHSGLETYTVSISRNMTEQNGVKGAKGPLKLKNTSFVSELNLMHKNNCVLHIYAAAETKHKQGVKRT